MCDLQIYKVGLSVSPESRRQSFQKAMPRGSFRWVIDRASGIEGDDGIYQFPAAKAGEDAMKQCLVECGSEWLGGEFYLAAQADINKAWSHGLSIAALHVNE